ncbi:MAG: helix-turn-helix transcriptional regulator [Ilumatobacteraceae bacterium]
MDVGTQLRRCRTRAGLSQDALAQAAGTSQPTVAAYETGRVTPNVDTLARLLEACGYTIDVVPDTDAPRWTRVEEKSLAIHRQIAARLLQDPAPTLRKARANLATLRSADRGHASRWLDEWSDLLDRPTDEIVTVMLARTQQGIDLRQMTPFAGVLTDAERRRAVRSVPSSDSA